MTNKNPLVEALYHGPGILAKVLEPDTSGGGAEQKNYAFSVTIVALYILEVAHLYARCERRIRLRWHPGEILRRATYADIITPFISSDISAGSEPSVEAGLASLRGDQFRIPYEAIDAKEGPSIEVVANFSPRNPLVRLLENRRLAGTTAFALLASDISIAIADAVRDEGSAKSEILEQATAAMQWAACEITTHSASASKRTSFFDPRSRYYARFINSLAFVIAQIARRNCGVIYLPSSLMSSAGVRACEAFASRADAITTTEREKSLTWRTAAAVGCWQPTYVQNVINDLVFPSLEILRMTEESPIPTVRRA